MPNKIKRVCVVLVDRANYGRLYPVMREIQNDSELDLVTLCAGTMLLERFGQAEKVVEADGFSVDSRVYLEVEGSIPVTMAKSIGVGVMEFSNEFQRLDIDMVLLIGDRYEALSAAIAAAYMNIPLAHVQGGEVSGSIDESARHAITKFAHLHFPSTDRSAEYIIRMGEHPEHVHNTGCPVGDYILKLDSEIDQRMIDQNGVGGSVNIDEPFFLVIFHPVTTEYGVQRAQAEELINALAELSHPTIWIWPNIDAGADQISKALRVFREHNSAEWLYLVKNMEPGLYQKVLKRAACAIGNSSSFIRDTTFSGTPVVMVGDRQQGREYAENLVSCEVDASMIMDAVSSQLSHGRYTPSELYGTGDASARIVKTIKEFVPYTQKILSYPFSI